MDGETGSRDWKNRGIFQNWKSWFHKTIRGGIIGADLEYPIGAMPADRETAAVNQLIPGFRGIIHLVLFVALVVSTFNP